MIIRAFQDIPAAREFSGHNPTFWKTVPRDIVIKKLDNIALLKKAAENILEQEPSLMTTVGLECLLQFNLNYEILEVPKI